MPHHAAQDATIDALAAVSTAVIDLLARLRAADSPDERDALGAGFAARIDDLRADLGRRHGLTTRDAAAMVACALVHAGELGQAVSGRA
jgi:hypothetical protein